MTTTRRSFISSAAALSALPFLPTSAMALKVDRPLPIPDVITVKDEIGSLEAIAGKSNFLTGVQTETIGYNQPFLGPVLRFSRGRNARMKVKNRLEFPITTHWHGLHVSADLDGGPMIKINPGETWAPELPVDQPAATLWYHSHIDDIPLVIQDRAFAADGAFRYVKWGPALMHGFRADTILVNGAVRPTATVPKGITRLRLLNGSNARMYTLRFLDNRIFHQVATDGGLLPAPIAMKTLRLAPAERAEILVDFGDGKSAFLVSGPDNSNPMGAAGAWVV